jgi:hemin uptake protein HemP
LTQSLNNDRTAAMVIPTALPRHRLIVSDDENRERPSPVHEPAATPALRSVDSAELMQGQREILIRHGTEAYRLSVTRSGKLILRK